MPDVAEEGEETAHYYFQYSATLRIFGLELNTQRITETLGVNPTHTHRQGDPRGTLSPFQHDMWSYESPVDADQPLHSHIDKLWTVLRPHKVYLLSLKQRCTVDVFLGYRSNCDTAGVEVPPHSLEMFVELQIPFGISIIIA